MVFLEFELVNLFPSSSVWKPLNPSLRPQSQGTHCPIACRAIGSSDLFLPINPKNGRAVIATQLATPQFANPLSCFEMHLLLDPSLYSSQQLSVLFSTLPDLTRRRLDVSLLLYRQTVVRKLSPLHKVSRQIWALAKIQYLVSWMFFWLSDKDSGAA